MDGKRLTISATWRIWFERKESDRRPDAGRPERWGGMYRVNVRIALVTVGSVAAVLLLTAGNISENASIADAAATTFTNARDLGMLSAVVVAFMVSIGAIMAFESRRRQKMAEMNQRALDSVSAALQSNGLAMATSVHNLIEHNTKLNQSADTRHYEMMAFLAGRPCFMASDVQASVKDAMQHRRNRRATDAALLTERRDG